MHATVSRLADISCIKLSHGMGNCTYLVQLATRSHLQCQGCGRVLDMYQLGHHTAHL